MPHEGDSSGLIALIWAAWLSWWLFTWLDRFTPGQDGREHRPTHARGPTVDADAIPPSAARTSQNVDAMMVAEILRRDGAASLCDFLAKALGAYEQIVAAFDAGDRETLRAAVSPEVYRALADVIATREARGESAETVFSRIDPPKIIGVAIDGTRIEVSILFVGELFRLVRDAAGQLGGRENRCQFADVWTFERTASAGDGAWRVVATQAGT